MAIRDFWGWGYPPPPPSGSEDLARSVECAPPPPPLSAPRLGPAPAYRCLEDPLLEGCRCLARAGLFFCCWTFILVCSAIFHFFLFFDALRFFFRFILFLLIHFFPYFIFMHGSRFSLIIFFTIQDFLLFYFVCYY